MISPLWNDNVSPKYLRMIVPLGYRGTGFDRTFVCIIIDWDIWCTTWFQCWYCRGTGGCVPTEDGLGQAFVGIKNTEFAESLN